MEANARLSICRSKVHISHICFSKVIKNDHNTVLHRIYDYATTSTSNSAYVIGGYIDSRISSGVIARYKNDCWSNIGNLKTSRSKHSAITIGSITMVVGGENQNDIP